jgi:DNA-binding MarR family transcriptional regulator
LFRVVRYSHIFASAVREVLEESLLREISPYPLSVPQFHLLRLLSLNGLHQVGEAAGFLGISAPAATKNVDKLEALGLVVRTPSPDDRRAFLISVSPRGRRLVKSYESISRTRLQRISQSFQPEELRQFAQLLERMSVRLFQLAKPNERFCLRCAAYIEEDCPVSHAVGGCSYQEMRRTRVQQSEAKPAP